MLASYELFIRLGNLLHLTKFNHNTVWKIVKEIRTKYMLEYVPPTYECEATIVTIEKYADHVKHNLKALEEHLELNGTGSHFENITNETLENAAKMFTYLNFCPSKLLFLYKRLLKTASPREMILTMTSLLKNSQNAAKVSSTKIFIKTMEILNLRNYPLCTWGSRVGGLLTRGAV